MTPAQFRQIVWKHYREHGRHSLPWRATHNPYHILVSEVMLQQTQVDRVIPYYRAFLKRFPTLRALASAPLTDVLTLWQGLGYNRRAKLLQQAAKEIVQNHKGVFPKDIPTILTLPGVGPYTARAVAAFAYNTDSACIETNIRTVFTHHFFKDKKEVSDEDILDLVEKTFPKGKAREWYAALMDYGTFLKKSGTRLNARAKGYRPQKPFTGSLREVRGHVLRTLSKGPATKAALLKTLHTEREPQLTSALQAFMNEQMIARTGRTYSLPR